MVESVSEARLSSVLDLAGDGIVVLDGDGTIMMASKACEQLFGRTTAQLAGRPVADLLAEDETSDLANLPERLIGQGRETRARHRDGACFPVDISFAEASTPLGRQYVGVIRDLRPRREAEERLSHLQAELTQLARVAALDEMGSALAHELNQPLTAIILYLQAATRAQAMAANAGAAGNDMVPAILAKAVREAERASHIIQSMRQFVEKRLPDRQPVAFNPLVEEALELALLGQGSAIRVTRSLGADLPTVCVDGVQIQQIVVNLLRNAIEAMAGSMHKRVWVETRARDGNVTLTVRDSGPGVPKTAVGDLFKPFATSKQSGLGLGLAISRSIAQNHGGDLTVDPGSNGRGATFSLILPGAAHDASAERNQAWS